MRFAIAAVLLAMGDAALGEEPAGLVAESWLWPDPDGPPSGSRRSAARPITGDVEEAWSVRLPGEACQAPIHAWGVVYMLCRDGGKQTVLVAYDIATGAERARMRSGTAVAPDVRMVYADGLVVYPTDAATLTGFRMVGKGFNKSWSYKAQAGIRFGGPVALGPSLYLATDQGILSVRAGASGDSWASPGQFGSLPAIAGADLLIVEEPAEGAAEGPPALAVLDRSSGRARSYTALSCYSDAARAPAALPGRVFAGPRRLVVRGRLPFLTSNRSEARFALIPREGAAGLAEPGFTSFAEECRHPVFWQDRLLVLDGEAAGKPPAWMLWGEEKGQSLAEASVQPDLFACSGAPALLGDIAYFGNFAVDLATREILWRLPRQDFRFPAVPADGMVLLVDEEDRLLAYRERR